MSKLYRLIYYSKNLVHTLPGSALNHIQSIFETANRKNLKNGITGNLIFDDESFIQILEGERSRVYSTFKDIEIDHRHSGVSLVEFKSVNDRIFPNWSMAGSLRTSAQDSIYKKHGVDKILRPSKFSADEIVSLLCELHDFQLLSKIAMTG